MEFLRVGKRGPVAFSGSLSNQMMDSATAHTERPVLNEIIEMRLNSTRFAH